MKRSDKTMISGITLANLLKRKSGQMPEIKEHVLRFADNTNSIESMTAVPIQDADKEWFELHVKVSDDSEVYTVTNARDNARTWVQLNTLYDFVREQCPKYVANKLKAKKLALGIFISEKRSE